MKLTHLIKKSGTFIEDSWGCYSLIIMEEVYYKCVQQYPCFIRHPKKAFEERRKQPSEVSAVGVPG